MQTSQDCGARNLHRWTWVLPSHKVVRSSYMQDALSLGPPNFNLRLHCTLHHKPYVTSFLSWGCCRKWRSKISWFFVPSPMCIAKSLKTSLVPSRWQGFLTFALGPSTSTYAIIIFVTMCKGAYQNIPHWHQKTDCWRSHQAPGTKWLSTSSLLQQQVTLTSYQNEGVLHKWYFGT